MFFRVNLKKQELQKGEENLRITCKNKWKNSIKPEKLYTTN